MTRAVLDERVSRARVRRAQASRLRRFTPDRLEKIRSVRHHNWNNVFEVRLAGRMLMFPYAKSEPPPSREDPVRRVFVDPEVGREGFTYELTLRPNWNGVPATVTRSRLRSTRTRRSRPRRSRRSIPTSYALLGEGLSR